MLLTMNVSPKASPPPISSPLEDYLETIYLLVQEHGFARVQDIARARDVKAATVSMALRKLAGAGLVDYERREYIAPHARRAKQAARRILTRHRLLTRFFEEVLRMSPDAAGEQACAMEHSLTDEADGPHGPLLRVPGQLPIGGRDLPALPARRARRGDGTAPCGRLDAGECARCGAKAEADCDEHRRPEAGPERGRDADLRHRRAAPAPARHGDPARDRRSTSSARARAATRSGSAARARGWPCAAARRAASASAGRCLASPPVPARSVDGASDDGVPATPTLPGARRGRDPRRPRRQSQLREDLALQRAHRRAPARRQLPRRHRRAAHRRRATSTASPPRSWTCPAPTASARSRRRSASPRPS